MAGNDVRIHVITTQPNRYKSFSKAAKKEETDGNVTINRISVPRHASGFTDQIKSYLVYYTKAQQLANRKYDLVYASSSRLFTAYLGKQIAERNKAVLYLDIRDLFVETMDEILNRLSVFKRPLLFFIHRFFEVPTFKNANHINLVSEGFKPYFTRYKNASYSFFTNAIDEQFLGLQQREGLPSSPKIITYAGNIGEGQGLEKIIPQAAAQLGEAFRFIIIGDGGTRAKLEGNLKSLNINNVELRNPVKRDEIIELYRNSHYLFLHLNDYVAFERVIPSKLFEYGGTNLPIVAGVAGYAAKFVQQHLTNYILFTPCSVNELVEKIKAMPYKTESRDTFIQKYSRSGVSDQLAASILNYL